LLCVYGSYTDIPALKELEEWFDTKEEFRAIAKLDPFFEKTSKLASRRLKRELERRGTLGEPLDPKNRYNISVRLKWLRMKQEKDVFSRE